MKNNAVPIATLYLTFLITIVIGLFFLPSSANGSLDTEPAAPPPVEFTFQAKLLPATLRQANARFGSAVAISQDTITVGQPNASLGEANQGAAHVFQREGSTWTQAAQLTAPDTIANQYFGSSVAIDGNIIVVGAYGDGDRGQEAGAAYVYMRQNQSWALQTKLTAPDGAVGDHFGFSVSISGSTIVVGAPLKEADSYMDIGVVYVFVQDGDNWVLQQKLSPYLPADHALFGYAVDMWGEQLVVGMPQVAEGRGRVQLFWRIQNTWYYYYFIDGTDFYTNPGDNFGHSVSIYHDTIVVGAPFQDDSYTHSVDNGAIYIMQWWDSVELLPPTYIPASSGEQGGFSVDNYRDIPLMGIPYATTYPSLVSGGSVRLGTYPTWEIPHGLVTAQEGAQFGWSVARNGNDIVVGAPGDGSAGLAGEGAVYVYGINGPPWEAASPTPVNFWPTATFVVASLTPEHIPSYTPTQYVAPVFTPTDTLTPSSTPVTPTSLANAFPWRSFFTQRDIMLTWNAITWATGYEIEIDDAIDFRSLIREDYNLPASTLSFSTTLDNGTYFWRVRAKRIDGKWGSWSVVESFVVSAP